MPLRFLSFLCLLGSSLLVLPLAGQDSVVKTLEQRIQRDPEDIFALNRLAGEYLQAYRNSGDATFIQRAAEAAEASLKALGEPGNAGVFAALLAVNLARHRFVEALADAETYRRLKPDSVHWRELRFDALVELHRLEEAAAEGAKIKERVGESLGWHARLARLARAQGNPELEKKHWNGAVAFARADSAMLSPHWQSWACLQRGTAALDRGDQAEAEADFLEVQIARSDPANRSAWPCCADSRPAGTNASNFCAWPLENRNHPPRPRRWAMLWSRLASRRKARVCSTGRKPVFWPA